MKYGANLLEKQIRSQTDQVVSDHKQRMLSAAASRTATYVVELFATIANGF